MQTSAGLSSRDLQAGQLAGVFGSLAFLREEEEWLRRSLAARVPCQNSREPCRRDCASGWREYTWQCRKRRFDLRVCSMSIGPADSRVVSLRGIPSIPPSSFESAPAQHQARRRRLRAGSSPLPAADPTAAQQEESAPFTRPWPVLRPRRRREAPQVRPRSIGDRRGSAPMRRYTRTRSRSPVFTLPGRPARCGARRAPAPPASDAPAGTRCFRRIGGPGCACAPMAGASDGPLPRR